jgi:drug/metabolite transporter (DMT)-like permease
MTSEAPAGTSVGPRTLAAFAALVVVAGGNAVAIRYLSCDSCELDPFWAAGTRFGLAAVLFVGAALVLRVGLPHGRALVGAALFGLLQFAGGFGLIYWGLVSTPAGLGQVLLASVPLLTFFLALGHRQERFRWGGLGGALVAVAGAAIVFSSGFGTGVPLVSMVAILVGAALWAEALVVIKAFPAVHPAALNALAMGIGAVALLLVSAISSEEWTVPSSGRAWLAQTYLVLLGSVGVFWLYVVVVRRWTASAASYQMVLIPLVTVALSAWLQDEAISWTFAVGGFAVLVGVYVGALRPAGGLAARPAAASRRGRSSP